jgi:hypothetical protein
MDQLGTQDPARLGGRAQPSGFDDDKAVEIAVAPLGITDAEPDANRRRGRICVGVLPAFEPLLDRDRRLDGIRCRTERSHDAVTQQLHDLAEVADDARPEQLIVALPEPIEGRLPDADPQVGRVDEICEENRPRLGVPRHDPSTPDLCPGSTTPTPTPIPERR